jgi:hypothetical protein
MNKARGGVRTSSDAIYPAVPPTFASFDVRDLLTGDFFGC